MKRFNTLFLILATCLLCQLQACKKYAGNPAEAAAILTGTKLWQIDEIAVNDAVTFKDGKMTQQFGSIDFERYMETVELKKDGTFSGIFKGESKPFILKWTVNEKDITVNAPDVKAKGGEWTIVPQDVSDESFSMKTQSTAYDYPRMTKVALKFKPKK
ncbi:MAG: hypothetical protein ABIN80_16715 [Dyadobacter sp.]|uniref:hypothetical protein n=1 Tax=Dyadobacter sp. TaxID=1914288 RepID=UPI003264DA58